MKTRAIAWCTVGLAATLAACATPTPQPKIIVGRGPTKVSMNIDANDYNEIAKSFYDSLAESNAVPTGKVVALGPVVNDLEPGKSFDAKKLQDKISTIALSSGRLRFNFAVNAMRDRDVEESRLKVMQLQFAKESTVDPEELRTFGTLANVDYLVFGRATSQTVREGGSAEVTYTFVWQLGDCSTGLLVWQAEKEITKSDLRPDR